MIIKLKKQFHKLSLGEKICRKVKANEIVTDKEKCFFISGNSNCENIKKTINGLKLRKTNIVILLKSRLSGRKQNNSTIPVNAGMSNQDITIENFATLTELLKKLRQNKAKTLVLHYPDNINKINFLYEFCSLLANSRKIIGFDKYDSAYELKGSFFLYKTLLSLTIFIFWSIPKFCLFLLTSFILAPFVTIFWVIILLLMVFK